MSMQYEFLENVCDILDSQRIPVTAVDRKAGPYPYYGANGVQDYVADYIFDDELVLLAEDGGNFGSKDKPIAYRVSGKCWVNNHAHVLKPKNCIDIDYFCYSIKFYDTSRLVNGATRQKLTQAAMRKMLIPMREIEIQRGIAVKIGRIEYLIQKRKDQLNRIDDLVKSQFIEMFGDVVRNEKGWHCETIDDVAPIEPYKGKIDTRNGKIWLLNLDMVEAQTGEIISKVEVAEEEIGSSTTTFCEDNVLYSKLRPYLNKVVVPMEKGYATSELVPLKPNSKKLHRLYFATALRSDAFVGFIQEQVAGAKMPRVSMGVFRNFRMPCPPITLQNQFAAFVEQTDKSKIPYEMEVAV